MDYVFNEEMFVVWEWCLNNLIIFIIVLLILYGIYILEFFMIIVFIMSFFFKKCLVDFFGSDCMFIKFVGRLLSKSMSKFFI